MSEKQESSTRRGGGILGVMGAGIKIVQDMVGSGEVRDVATNLDICRRKSAFEMSTIKSQLKSLVSYVGRAIDHNGDPQDIGEHFSDRDCIVEFHCRRPAQTDTVRESLR